MRFWKLIFTVAAVFNWAVGLPMLLAPAELLAAIGQPVPADLLTTQLAALLIVVLGVGYAMASRDPNRNRGILWLGVLGKAPLPLLVWLNGGMASSAFMLSLGDLAFAVLFLLFLLTHRGPAAA